MFPVVCKGAESLHSRVFISLHIIQVTIPISVTIKVRSPGMLYPEPAFLTRRSVP